MIPTALDTVDSYVYMLRVRRASCCCHSMIISVDITRPSVREERRYKPENSAALHRALLLRCDATSAETPVARIAFSLQTALCRFIYFEVQYRELHNYTHLHTYVNKCIYTCLQVDEFLDVYICLCMYV